MPSSHHKPNWLGRPAQEMDAHFAQLAGEKPMIAKCAFCPWTLEGTAHDVIAAARAHREQEHPTAKWTKHRHRRSIKRPIRLRDLTVNDLHELEAERQRRARLHGITEELV